MVNTAARAAQGPIPASASADPRSQAGNYTTLNELKSDQHTHDSAISALQKVGRKGRKNIAKDKSLEVGKEEETLYNPTASDEESTSANDTTRLSRKQRRRIKKKDREDPATTPDHQSSPQSPHRTPALSSQPTLAMPPTTYHPLLVCSLGNPGAQYANTLHSAGHTMLQHVRDRGRFKAFTKGMGGLIAPRNDIHYKFGLLTGYSKSSEKEAWAAGEDYFTLWQSTKLMNVSGPAVRSAWKEFSSIERAKGFEPRLVVVHDELEAPLGRVGIKEGTASARGHNGLKSVQASLGSGVKWWRIGVGIGRPESRDAAVVSKYVLRKMTFPEQKKLEEVSGNVLTALRRVAEGEVN